MKEPENILLLLYPLAPCCPPEQDKRLVRLYPQKYMLHFMFFLMCSTFFFSSLSLLSFTPPSLFSRPVGFFTRGVELGPAFPELWRRRITEKRGTSQECSWQGLSRQGLCRPRTCLWPVRRAPCRAGLLHPAQRGQNSLNAPSLMP